MSRRGLGRGRVLMGLGALMALVSMALPWFTAGGRFGLPVREGRGFEGAGIVVFVGAVAILAVLALPYASKAERSTLDRPITFIALAGLAVAGYIIRLVQLVGQDSLGLPDRAPGLWLAGAGLLLMAWGAAEILAQPAPAR